MDITNLMSTYTNQATQASNKMDSQLNADYTKASDKELMDACKKFESYFVEQMFKEMSKTVGQTEDSTASMTSLKDYVKDNLVQEVASNSTEQGTLGLAQMLYEQMKRNYNI